MLKKLKSKTIGYWFACTAAIIALFAVIIFGIYKNLGGNGNDIIYQLILIGILLQVVLFFYDGTLGPVLSIGATVLYTLAMGFSLEGGIGNLTDYFSNIVCFGIPELAPLNFAIAALLIVSILLSIVSCFLHREKTEKGKDGKLTNMRRI